MHKIPAALCWRTYALQAPFSRSESEKTHAFGFYYLLSTCRADVWNAMPAKGSSETGLTATLLPLIGWIPCHEPASC
eukprot:6281054-Amphidinium_carterae.1